MRPKYLLAILLLLMPASEISAQPAVLDLLEAPLPEGAIARLGTTRFRTGAPWASNLLSISRDGKRLLTGGAGGLHVWNVATGQLIRRLPVQPVCESEFTADGSRLIVNELVQSGQKYTSILKVYDLATGKVLRVIEGTKQLGTFALSPDGRTVALEFHVADGKDGNGDYIYRTHLELRQLETDKVLHTFGVQSSTQPMGHLFFSPDGKSLIAISVEMNRSPDARSNLRHFDSATAKLQWQAQVDCVGPGRRLGWNKGLLTIGKNTWDLKTGEKRMDEERRWGRSVHVSRLMPDGKSAVVNIPARREVYEGRYGAGTREVEPARFALWDIAKDKEIRKLPDHWGGHLTPDGKSSFTVSMGGAIHHWDLASGKEVLPLDGADEIARALVFTADQKRLVRVDLTVSGDHLHWHVSAWDVATGKRVHHAVIDEISHVTGLNQFTPDQTFLTGGSTLVHTFDLATWKHGKRRLEGLGIEADAADSAQCQLSPDGKTVAVCYNNIRGEQPFSRTVTLWDWPTGKKIGELKGHDELAVAGGLPAVFSPDGKLFAAALHAPPDLKVAPTAKPGPIQLWNVADRNILRTWPTTELYLSFLAFGPDGKSLIGRFHNGKVCVWDTATGKEKLNFQPPTRQPTNFYAALSPNGKLVATADQDSNVVRFWDLVHGQQVGEFHGPTGHMACLTFAPDSRLLAVGASDTTVLLVDVRKIVGGK
jgi:WD40 repeat protein